MHWGYGGFGWLVMALGSLLVLAVLVGLILLAIWAARRTSGGGPLLGSSPAEPRNAREILQARYARGEITREQYQQMLADIER